MIDAMTDTQFTQLCVGLFVAWLVGGLCLGVAIGTVIKRNDRKAELAYHRARFERGRR